MTTLTEGAFAKLNLTLDILDKREDGYHNLESVMQTVSLHDDITVQVDTGRPWELHCFCEQPSDEAGDAQEPALCTDSLPQGAENLGWLAAEAFFRRTGRKTDGLEIFINKRIPSQAGLGGGSADAAAVLRCLNRHYGMPLSLPALAELGAQVGSDVPFCVLGGTALVKGRGEYVTTLPAAPEMYYVICKPDFGVSTAELYATYDAQVNVKHPDSKAMMANLQKGELLGVGGCLCNVFEPMVMEQHFDINYIKSMLFTYGAYGAQMTGSGSAVFGIFHSFEYAAVACTMLKDKYKHVFIATNV